MWRGYVDKIVKYQVMGRAEEEAHGAEVHYVSATRSSESLQFHMDRQIEKNKHNLPEKVQDYIEKGTRDVPLWEEYKVCCLFVCVWVSAVLFCCEGKITPCVLLHPFTHHFLFFSLHR